MGRAAGIDRQEPDPSCASLNLVGHRLWWVRARLVTDLEAPGLSLEAIKDQIDSDHVHFDIEQAAGTTEFAPLARLTLRHADPSPDDVGFDPILNCHPDVQLVPAWLGDFRRATYRSSREGREATR